MAQAISEMSVASYCTAGAFLKEREATRDKGVISRIGYLWLLAVEAVEEIFDHSFICRKIGAHFPEENLTKFEAYP